MTKHTPGPWHIEESYHTAINSGPSDQPHKHIAMVNFFNCADETERVNEEEHKANARLIAAAPDLLLALEEALEAFETASDGGGVDFYAYAKTTRKVITKAKGES